MHVAGTGFDDRHFGVAHDGLDQTRSSSRHEHVDMASRLHHGGGSGASVLVDGLHQRGFETVGFKHRGDDAQRGSIGAFGGVTASQQRGIARFKAQAGHVHSDVRPGLINHADDAHRYARLGKAQTVGQIVSAHDFADRIRQGGHMAHALGGGGHARHVEQQAVKLARIHAVFLGFEHVQRVGGFDVRSMLVQRVRNGKQQFVFGFGICLCKTLLCACGLIGLAAHRVEHLRTQFIAHKKQE